MSRALDWVFGRQKLREKIVDLEKRVEVREGQIIKAAEVVREVKNKLLTSETTVHTLTFENNLLKKTSEILNKNS